MIPAEQIEHVKQCRYLWISHGHPDHLSLPSLEMLRDNRIDVPATDTLLDFLIGADKVAINNVYSLQRYRDLWADLWHDVTAALPAANGAGAFWSLS